MDDDTAQAPEARVPTDRDGPSARPAEGVLLVLFYVAMVIWAVSVVVNIWSVWPQSELTNLQGSDARTRLQLVVAAIGGAWGYLLIAVVALFSTEFLRARD